MEDRNEMGAYLHSIRFIGRNYIGDCPPICSKKSALQKKQPSFLLIQILFLITKEWENIFPAVGMLKRIDMFTPTDILPFQTVSSLWVYLPVVGFKWAFNMPGDQVMPLDVYRTNGGKRNA